MCSLIIECAAPLSDRERLEKLLWELDDVIYPKLSERVNIKEYAQKLSQNAELFYARYNAEDIGHCAVYMNDEVRGFITSFALKKEWQNKGIGRLLWEAAEKQAKEKRIRELTLMVYEKNHNAISFYKKMGFVERARKNNWITMWYELERSV